MHFIETKAGAVNVELVYAVHIIKGANSGGKWCLEYVSAPGLQYQSLEEFETEESARDAMRAAVHSLTLESAFRRFL